MLNIANCILLTVCYESYKRVFLSEDSAAKYTEVKYACQVIDEMHGAGIINESMIDYLDDVYFENYESLYN